mgnify:CR=1 FL=1
MIHNTRPQFYTRAMTLFATNVLISYESDTTAVEETTVEPAQRTIEAVADAVLEAMLERYP